MKLIFKAFFILAIALSSSVHADRWYSPVPANKLLFHKIEAFGTYEGENDGKFKDDILVSLSDGSQWKIHPQDTHSIKDFNVGEDIYLGVRLRTYFFNRDHFFTISKKGTFSIVRVKLIKMPEEPLKIVNIKESINFIKYYRNLTLSDGSEWVITEDFQYYDIGDTVYVSCRKPFERGPGVLHYLFRPDEMRRGYPVVTETRPVSY